MSDAGGEAVDEQVPNFLGVAWRGFLERSEALSP
jgi:hypothetical protein